MSETGIAKDHKDFFISYTSTDRQWAEWIALELEKAGYQTIIQAWDFRPGSNFLAEMDEAAKMADRTIAVVSPKYFESDYTFVEWATALRGDPKGKQRKLLPIRVEPCHVEGLLGPVVYIDLVSLDEQAARERLLEGIRRQRIKPDSVLFPASSVSKEILQEHRAFPGDLPPTTNTPSQNVSINFMGPASGVTIGEYNRVSSHFSETPTHPPPLERVWNIPYPHNPFFTGRKDLLSRLQTQLQTGQPSALSQPQAISGLGGIGKTQIAVQYAYQHHEDYQAVLWARAESREELISSFVEIATLLDLPQKDVQDQTITVQAVKHWLQANGGWLFILDNADEPAIVREFLPTKFDGHILLTTRAQALGRLAQRIEVETFTPELGALFLLRRATLIAPEAVFEQAVQSDREVAIQISQELGGLPLALDQAGAYLEETGCRLQDYQRIYQQRRTKLLKERRGLVEDHPEPVATTWSISFARVEEKNPAAAELLRFCTYLSPEDIAEEMIIQGAPHLGPLLEPVASDSYELNQAIEVLKAYSLVQRDPSTGALSIHRLVQAVLRDALPAEEAKLWAQRTVCAVNAAFPEAEFTQWSTCERYLPHALTCAELVRQHHLSFAEAAQLLQQTGWYVAERARYREAVPLLERALAISEQVQGKEHLDTARDAVTLGWLYNRQGKYGEAEPLYDCAHVA